MSFWNRIRTTFAADAHGVIDALEDRALLLKQHLRDAELELENKRARLSALDAEREHRGRELQRLRAETDGHERDAELALAAAEERLARYALQQWLSKKQACERISERLQGVASEREGLAAALAQQEPALAELRTQVAAYLADRNQAGAGQPLALEPRPVAAELVELELLRRRRQAAQPGDTKTEVPDETR